MSTVWGVETLGALCTFENGDRGKNYPSRSAFVEQGIPFINAGNLCNEGINKDTLNHISRERYDLLSNGKIRRGDILFCLRGSLGKFAIVEDLGEGAIASSLVIIRNGKRLSSEYLAQYLKSPLCAKQIATYENGAAQPNLSARDLKAFEIPLPPLPEQRRIAAILDKADAIRRKRQQAIGLTEEFLRSVFLDMFGDPVLNPKGWEVRPLQSLVNFTTGKLDSNAAVPGGKYPFFTCSRENFEIDTFAFDCEALLLAGNNASADYSVKYYNGKFNAYQRTYVITMARDNLSIRYMQYALEMKLKDMKRLSKGTNTKYLTLGILNELKFQVPDEGTQAKFEEVKGSLECNKARHDNALLLAEDNFNSLVQRAFRGEL